MPGSEPAEQRRLRVLVVDDEAPARDELEFLLGQDDLVQEVLVVSRADEALRHLTGGAVDVVLSDVHMPGLDGLALARAIGRLAAPPAVVFVTAHEEHALQAFDLAVVDYVLKPVRAARLAAALRRAVAGQEARARQDRTVDETLPVELGGVTRFVRRSSVLWAEAQGDYVRLHTAEGSHLLRSTLSQLEERWSPHGFVRVHRSLLVAASAVRELRHDDGRYALVVGEGPDSHELPVARRNAREVRERLAAAAGGPGARA